MAHRNMDFFTRPIRANLRARDNAVVRLAVEGIFRPGQAAQPNDNRRRHAHRANLRHSFGRAEQSTAIAGHDFINRVIPKPLRQACRANRRTEQKQVRSPARSGRQVV